MTLVGLKRKKKNLLNITRAIVAHQLPVKDEHQFDTELVSKIIGLSKLEHGKAPDIDDLCTEDLYYCHPVISIILVKFFQLIFLTSYIPTGFRYNYTVSQKTSPFLLLQ